MCARRRYCAYQNYFIHSFASNLNSRNKSFLGGRHITEIMDRAKLILNILGILFLIPGLIMLFLGGTIFLFGAAMASIGVCLFWIPHTHSKDKIERE